MKKKIKLTISELSNIYNSIGGNVSLYPEKLCIDTVYINCFNYVSDPGLFETYNTINPEQSEQKNNILKNILEEINKNKKKLDACILENKKVINDFFEIVQTECEKKEITFNEKLIVSFWINLNGGAYGGGKEFLNNAIKSICSYSETASYKTNVFLNPLNAKPLLFDKGTMSYICARPSAGKTTALLNVLIDALHQDRKVVYFTAEETIEQLSVKIIKNEFYRLCNNNSYKSLLNKITRQNTQEYFKERIKYLFSMTKEGRKQLKDRVKLQGNSDQDLIDYKILEAIEFLNEKAQEEKLQFVVVSLLEGFEGLRKEIALQEPDTIILLDYIQKLPIPQSAQNYTQAYSQLKNLVNELSCTIRDNGLIGIAGAQMGRETDKGKTDQLLSMSYIRECGDIENDATLCIGIGKNKDTNQRFYNVMKARNTEYNETKLVLLYDRLEYSYLKTQGELKENGLLQLELYKPGTKKNETNDEGLNFEE